MDKFKSCFSKRLRNQVDETRNELTEAKNVLRFLILLYEKSMLLPMKGNIEEESLKRKIFILFRIC